MNTLKESIIYLLDRPCYKGRDRGKILLSTGPQMAVTAGDEPDES